jgi:hypothetical protein
MKYLFEISGCLKVKEIEDYENELNKTLRDFGMKESVHFAGPISTITVSSDMRLNAEELGKIEDKIREAYGPHVNHLKITHKEI